MNTPPTPAVPPLKPLTRKAIRERLEDDREALAMITLLASRLMSRNDDLWMATQADEAPEFAAMSRLARAS